MRILHVVRDLDAKSGGPSQSVPNLSQALIAHGVDSHVVFEDRGNTLTPAISTTHQESFRPLTRVSRFWSTKQFSNCLSKTIGTKWDLIHLHGIWNGMNHAAASFARKRNIPYIISPRGMMEPWAINHKKRRKQLAMWVYQRNDLRKAACLHATSEAEIIQLRRLGLTNPIEIIGNATEFPPHYDEANIIDDADAQKQPKRRALFLSRIHPVKGLNNLVQAWAAVRPANWECIICGPSEDGHAEKIQKQIDANQLSEQIRIQAAVSGNAKWELFQSAELFLLPSHSENFGIAIAEALASGLPVITTKNTPWQILESKNCGWWVEGSAEGIESALRVAFKLLPNELKEMGQNGRNLAMQELSWNKRAIEMSSLYKRFLA